MNAPIVAKHPSDRFMAMLVVACALVLPISVIEVGWVPRSATLLLVSLLGLACGVLIGPLRWPRIARWPVVTASALMLAASNAGLFNLDAPTAYARVMGWSADLSAGRVVDDPGLVRFWTALLVWWAGYSAAHGVASTSRALDALLPTLLLLTIHSVYIRYNLPYILIVLAGTIVLMTWTLYGRHQAIWTARQLDYPDLRLEWIGSGIFIAAIACLLAWVFPLLASRTTLEWVSRAFDPAVTRVRDVFLRASGGANPVRTSASGQKDTASLAANRIVGEPPQLSDKVVMWVWTDEPPPPPPDEALPSWLESTSPFGKSYWRGMTFAIYTGRGWHNPPLASRPLSSTLPGNLTQRFEIVVPHGDTIFAANQPVSGSAGLSALYLPGAETDVIGLRGASAQYTVTSRLIITDEETLRQSPMMYSPEVTPYLQLPNTLPQRVRDLTTQVTAGALTPYDKAIKIETFLRTYSYTLDLPPLPQGRDLVDYFLFDAPGGYCDYYASAMVVMLRVVGVPARLASGYTRGVYDYERGAYRVTSANAHSWPEVYFTGIGWIEFEPTAGRPVFPRARRVPQVSLSAEQIHAAQLQRRRLIVSAGIAAGIGLLIAALTTCLIRRERQLAALPAEAAIPLLYQRLRQRGAWLGVALRPGDTPVEFVAALQRVFEQRRLRWKTQALIAQQAAARIGELYCQASYSPRSPGVNEARQAWEAWRALRLRTLLFKLKV